MAEKGPSDGALEDAERLAFAWCCKVCRRAVTFRRKTNGAVLPSVFRRSLQLVVCIGLRLEFPFRQKSNYGKRCHPRRVGRKHLTPAEPWESKGKNPFARCIILDAAGYNNSCVLPWMKENLLRRRKRFFWAPEIFFSLTF